MPDSSVSRSDASPETPLPAPMAKRISDRIRRFAGLSDCTAEKVQRVYAGESLGDAMMEVAIRRELEEYGLV